MHNSQSESEWGDEVFSTHKRHDRHRIAPNSVTETDSSSDRHEKIRHIHEKYLLVIRPVNDRSREALDFRIYLLGDKASGYDDEVARSVSKWAKCLQVHI